MEDWKIATEVDLVWKRDLHRLLGDNLIEIDILSLRN